MGFPRGTVMRVRFAHAGFVHLETDKCQCCGISGRMTFKRVRDPNLIEFVEAGLPMEASP